MPLLIATNDGSLCCWIVWQFNVDFTCFFEDEPRIVYTCCLLDHRTTGKNDSVAIFWINTCHFWMQARELIGRIHWILADQGGSNRDDLLVIQSLDVRCLSLWAFCYSPNSVPNVRVLADSLVASGVSSAALQGNSMKGWRFFGLQNHCTRSHPVPCFAMTKNKTFLHKHCATCLHFWRRDVGSIDLDEIEPHVAKGPVHICALLCDDEKLGDFHTCTHLHFTTCLITCAFLHIYTSTHMHVYLPTSAIFSTIIHFCISTVQHFYISTCISVSISTFLHVYIGNYLSASPVHLHVSCCIHGFLSFYIYTFEHFYIETFQGLVRHFYMYTCN